MRRVWLTWFSRLWITRVSRVYSGAVKWWCVSITGWSCQLLGNDKWIAGEREGGRNAPVVGDRRLISHAWMPASLCWITATSTAGNEVPSRSWTIGRVGWTAVLALIASSRVNVVKISWAWSMPGNELMSIWLKAGKIISPGTLHLQFLGSRDLVLVRWLQNPAYDLGKQES